MPLSSLLMMTSPMLMGPVPQATLAQASMTETSVVAQAAIAAEVSEVAFPHGDENWELIPLTWSLTAGQEQGAGPPDESPNERGAPSGQEPPAENEIVVQGEYGPTELDPVEEFNFESYRITQELDDVFVEPIAYAYRDGLPGPLRNGLGNVVRNLGEPTNFLNFLLQLKVGKAFETLGRFAINSTLGLGGLIDIAGQPGINLPYRRNGFANTLGYYGVGPGAYLYLPVTGATSVRDIIGNSLDQLVLPTAVGAPFNRIEYAAPYFVISNLDARIEVDEELERIDQTIDPYAARRDTYLYRRELEIAILRGEEPPEEPLILQEIEGTIEPGEEFEDEELDGDGPERLSLIQPRELQPLASTVLITQPLTR